MSKPHEAGNVTFMTGTSQKPAAAKNILSSKDFGNDVSLPLGSSDDDSDLNLDDVSSNWSANDSIDLEVKELHR